MPSTKSSVGNKLLGEVIQKVDGLLKSGQADQIVSASAASVEARIQQLKRAEILDPQTLRLTVTI